MVVDILGIAFVGASEVDMDKADMACLAWVGTTYTGIPSMVVWETLGDTCLGMWEAYMVEIVHLLWWCRLLCRWIHIWK